MYKTVNEAKEAAARIAKNYNGEQFVITERKLTKNAKKTWYGFRCFFRETFRGEWYQEQDRSFCRMIEIIYEKGEAA
jgi:mannose/cellobiose epimerase-like protein (N-acyl-D-glucosamine 2-epimerase family)